MITDAVVLAGGFGTRLASVVRDVPKPMAPVAGRPFLEHLLTRLQQQKVRRVVLAVGHLHHVIVDYFGTHWQGLDIAYARESSPLGTGGALGQAFRDYALTTAFALNGDTFCTADLAALAAAHQQGRGLATLALVPVDDAGRYGAVDVDASGTITRFAEKSPQAGAGWINAGIYALDAAIFARAPQTVPYSFETAILQPLAGSAMLKGHCAHGAKFIDIGIPDDYHRAQTLLAPPA